MKVVLAATTAAMFMAGMAQASTVTLDLNSLPTGPFTTPLVVGEYQLTPNLGTSATPSILNLNGLNVLSNDDPKGSYAGNDVYLSRVDGGLFQLDSVVIGYEGPFRGAQAAGSSLAGGPLYPTLTPQTIRFGATFARSTSIDLNEQSGPYYAKITVTSGAPEPASWTFMLIGVGMLGAAIRIARQRAIAAA